MEIADTPGVIVTVDTVLLTLCDGTLHVALLKREHAPFEGVLALPGGYVHVAEDASTWDAAARVLRDKAGIESPYLEQLATFSGAGRDPRGWSVSGADCALVPQMLLRGGHGGVKLLPVEGLPVLPFDHKSIVAAAVARVRAKSQYSSLPVYLCGDSFTLPQLQAVYEAVLGEPINKVSFRRKIEQLGMLEAIDGAQEQGRANRPAQLYRLRKEFNRRLSLLDRALNARD